MWSEEQDNPLFALPNAMQRLLPIVADILLSVLSTERDPVNTYFYNAVAVLWLVCVLNTHNLHDSTDLVFTGDNFYNLLDYPVNHPANPAQSQQ